MSSEAFYAAHANHDVGWRHEDGRLYSATCHDCAATFRANDEPAAFVTCEHGRHRICIKCVQEGCVSSHHREPVPVTNGTDRCDECWHDAYTEQEGQR